MDLILASTSPYRRDLLHKIGLRPICQAPICDETPYPQESALDTAIRLAKTKAISLAHQHHEALIIGADQVALLDGIQIGKPKNFEDGVRMLLWMSGRKVRFHSAFALYNSKTQHLQEAVGITDVTFRVLSEATVRQYLSKEPDALNCAGSAKSESLGAVLIEKIETDDPTAIIGLPILHLISLLQNEGLELLA